MTSCNFVRLRFDRFEINDLVSEILKDENKLKVIVTPNIDHVVRSYNNKELLDVYNSAEICINDSRILNKIARAKGYDLGNVIPGSDLTSKVFDSIANTDFPIVIIGTDNDSIDIIKHKYNLNNIIHYNPPMGFIHDEVEIKRCIDLVQENNGRIIFLAVGSPRQELLAQRFRDKGITGSILCIGASLLFLSGKEKRAPKILQKLSLEWLFRLIQSPRRLLKRYVLDFIKLIPIVINEPRMNHS